MLFRSIELGRYTRCDVFAAGGGGKQNVAVTGGQCQDLRGHVLGHTVGKPVVYGYLPVELLDRTEFTIEVYGEPIPALRHDRPVYDPTSARLKA